MIYNSSGKDSGSDAGSAARRRQRRGPRRAPALDSLVGPSGSCGADERERERGKHAKGWARRSGPAVSRRVIKSPVARIRPVRRPPHRTRRGTALRMGGGMPTQTRPGPNPPLAAAPMLLGQGSRPGHGGDAGRGAGGARSELAAQTSPGRRSDSERGPAGGRAALAPPRPPPGSDLHVHRHAAQREDRRHLRPRPRVSQRFDCRSDSVASRRCCHSPLETCAACARPHR